MTLMLAFGIIVVLQAFGDLISAKTNGKLPSIFISMVFFLVGFWTVIPTVIPTADGTNTTILSISGISATLFNLMLTLLVTNMGSLMSVKELISQWKTIVIGLSGIVGVMIFCYFIGGLLFEREIGIMVAPPLSGGLAAMSIMSNAALKMNRPDLSTLAILTFSVQGLIGYPLMAFALRRHAVYVLRDYKAGKIKLLTSDNTNKVEAKGKFSIMPELPLHFNTPTVLIAKVAFVAWLAETAGNLSGGVIHTYVWCLVLGIIASEIGFLDKKIFNKADTMGLLMVLLMGYVFGTLATATLEMIGSVFIPLIGSMVIGTIGICLFGILVGKFIFKETWEMSIAIVINCLCGFPPNFVITKEASQSMSSNEDEYNILMQEMLPKVLVGGFATVTISSVIVANIFVKLI